jgi:hypothetical protein
MKTRVKTIHGKIPVTGGLNPENDLKSHEILVKENADGTVELKERNINGEIVSVSGGSSNASGLSIPFYYCSETENLSNLAISDFVEGTISYEAKIPSNKYGAKAWACSNGNINLTEGQACLSYYTIFTNGKDTLQILQNTWNQSFDTDSTDDYVLERLEEICKKDIYFLYYGEFSGGYPWWTHATSDLHDLEDAISTDGYLCYYDSKAQTITKVCPAAYVKGLMTSMDFTPSTYPTEESNEPQPASEDTETVQ